MSDRRSEFVSKIVTERETHYNMPGSEWDMKNTPNDWIAISASYLTDAATRKYTKPHAEDFEDNLIKAAAVILAALENIENMRNVGNFK